MVIQDHITQFVIFKVGINLRGRDAAVAEHFLDIPQVCTILQQVCGERVAVGVRGNLLADACFLRKFFNDNEDDHTGHSRTAAVQEQNIFALFVDFIIRTYRIDVFADKLSRV